MNINRIYDPTTEEVASTFPRFDVSDAVGTRDAVQGFFEALAAQGVERPTDDRIEEIERMIPGPMARLTYPFAYTCRRTGQRPGPGL